MDNKKELESVMKGNSYIQLKEIINDTKGTWRPEAIIAAQNELRNRDHVLKTITEKGISFFSNKEIETILSNRERYPEKIFELIDTQSGRKKTDSQIDGSNQNEVISKISGNYKVVPFNQSNNISVSLQSIIDREAEYGWKYVNHQYSDKLKPGSAGCFGIGATPDATIHVGFVIFQKN